MSFGTISITPYIKEFPSDVKTMESSLASYKMLRAPGTARGFIPKMEATGKYRTGLDKTANYLKALSKEERAIEEDKIDAILTKLKEHYPGEDFGPTSQVWNTWSNKAVKASRISIGNSEIFLKPDENPKDLLTWAWVRASTEIAKSKDAIENGTCPDCQYYLSNEVEETKSQFVKKAAVNKATAWLEKLRQEPTRMKKVCRLMGLPIADDTSEERCYVLLDDLLRESQIKKGDNAGRTSVILFNEICELSDENLNAKDLVERALRHNIYRTKEDKIVEGTTTIADSKSDLVRSLLKPENQKDYLALKKRVEAKESINK